ncbi:MAG TPA: HlyD family secretion protein [Methylomusa anaerophila]|uniref:Multidrug export protein EmrA n=1 Tax=Methylomusa anaerophila TaxID=1930071 RepID=A0A348AN39_9FIRM|nr:HlyD family secretion protein [Methylomusa anaerophila]BBB92487.1 multidrug export protein EmrA [Methylomusa anaerophila]HML87661.1 HlyD family secretion protein [Methylomusa anaerophila]
MNEPGGKKQKIVIGLLAAFLLLGGAGGGYYWYYTSRYVSTDDARISGTIVTISSKVSGKVSRILAAEGDNVKAGQVLARIDSQDILAQKVQAEASLAAAKANYEQLVNGSRPQEIQQARAAADQAKANLENASLNYGRMEQLFHDGAISASQRDNAVTTYQVAQEAYIGAVQALELAVAGPREEAVRAAAAQVKQAEAAVTALNLHYNDTTIISPVDGIVAQKSANAGEVVVMGQPLFSVIDRNDIWINARIEETYIGKLQLGQLVEYTIDGYPGSLFYGKIYDLGNAATSVFALIPIENASNNFTKVTQRIPIKISLPETSDVIFRPGMSVVIKVHLDKRG